MQRANRNVRPVDLIKEHVPISNMNKNTREPPNRVLMHESKQPIIRDKLQSTLSVFYRNNDVASKS